MKLEVLSTGIHGLKKSTIVTSIALDPSNSNVVVISCHDKSIIQLNVKDSKIISDPIQMDCLINELCWQPSFQERHDQEAQLVGACSDGSIVFFVQFRVGQTLKLKVKKIVAGHEGSVTAVKWSHDGSNLVSAGEDGEVKVWSQSGHLKSVIATNESCVNCLGWNYGGTAVVTAHDEILTILPFQNRGQRDVVEWKVSQNQDDSAVVLVVDWNNALDLILCGGEDCRYRVYDSTGTCLFLSSQLMHPITSAAWMLSGEAFVIGSYKSLHLCDREGLYAHHYDVEGCSSVLDMHFVQESSKIIAGCSNGNIVLADIIGRTVEWNGVIVEHAASSQLYLNFSSKINDNDNCDALDTVSFLESSIIDFNIGFQHLVVITTTQCHMYHLQKMSSPVLIPLSGNFALASMGSINVALLNRKDECIFIYSYTGRKVASFQCKGISRSSKLIDFVTVSTKYLGLVEPSDEKVIRLYRCSRHGSQNETAILEHAVELDCIRFCPLDLQDQDSEQMAMLDRNKDISIVSIDLDQPQTHFSPIYKIGMQMNSIVWNEISNILVSNSDSMINVYHCPGAPFIDIDLLPDTIEVLHLDSYDGATATISSFHGACICMKNNNGENHDFLLNQEPSIFYENSKLLNWKECYRYCRYVDTLHSWTSLACLALKFDNYEMAEYALVETKKVDKVEMIKHIRRLPDGERKLAEKHLYKRNFDQAIEILLQCDPPDYYRVIKFHLNLCQWEKALNTATRTNNDGYIDIVLWYRAAYLKQMKAAETMDSFISLTKTRPIISKERLSQLKSTLKWQCTTN